MVTTENRKLLMDFLEYSYVPYNSPNHQLKPRWTSGYWVKEAKQPKGSVLKFTIHEQSHPHLLYSKFESDAIIKKLPEFYDWNWIFKVVKQIHLKHNLVEEGFDFYSLVDMLLEANKEKVLEELIMIVKLKTETDGN